MFGRRKQQDEDPFAALKDGGTYQSSPVTVPDLDVGLGGGAGSTGGGAGSTGGGAGSTAPASAPATAGATPAMGPVAGPAPTPGSVQPSALGSGFTYAPGARRRRSGFSGPKVLVRLVLAGVAVAVVASVIGAVGSAVHSVSVPSFSISTSSPAPRTPAPTRRPVSYLTPSGLRSGLAHLKRLVPGASVILLRIDAKTLSATAVGRHGVVKQIYFSPAVTSVISATAAGERPVPLSQVRPSVVARLVSEMGSRFHVPASRIDYMVISSPPGLPPQWILFSKAPSHPGFAAALSGAGLHRI